MPQDNDFSALDAALGFQGDSDFSALDNAFGFKTNQAEAEAIDEDWDAGDVLLSLGKGVVATAQMPFDLVNMAGNLASDEYSKTDFAQGVNSVSDTIGEGSDYLESKQSPAYRREMGKEIYNEETGEWSMPGAAQVIGTIAETIPQIAMYMGGAGIAKAGFTGAAKLAGKNVERFSKLDKAMTVGSYGVAGSGFGGSDTFKETHEAVLTHLSNTDYTSEERNRIADGLAKTAAITQMPVAALTNMVGLGGAATGVSNNLLSAIAKGAVTDAIPEAIEEMSQGYQVNSALGKVDSDFDTSKGLINRAAMGAVVGGVMGGGVSTVEHMAQQADQKRRDAEYSSILDDLEKGYDEVFDQDRMIGQDVIPGLTHTETNSPKTVNDRSAHNRPENIQKIWDELQSVEIFVSDSDKAITERFNGSNRWKDENVINAVLNSDYETLTEDARMIHSWASQKQVADNMKGQANELDQQWYAELERKQSVNDIKNPQQVSPSEQPQEIPQLGYEPTFAPKEINGEPIADRPQLIKGVWVEAEQLSKMVADSEIKITEKLGSEAWKNKTVINAILDTEDADLTDNARMIKTWANQTYAAAMSMHRANSLDQAWYDKKQARRDRVNTDDFKHPRQHGDAQFDDTVIAKEGELIRPEDTQATPYKAPVKALSHDPIKGLEKGPIEMGADYNGERRSKYASDPGLGDTSTVAIAREIELAQGKKAMGVTGVTELPEPGQNTRTGQKFPEHIDQAMKTFMPFIRTTAEREDARRKAMVEAKQAKQKMLDARDQRVANVGDPRWRRDDFRGQTENMVEELVPGGGVTYIRDQNEVITGRTPSLNPRWFQQAPDNVKSLNVNGWKKAVKKAIKGDKLGKREKAVVHYLMDVFQSFRTEQPNIDMALAMRDFKRQVRTTHQQIKPGEFDDTIAESADFAPSETSDIDFDSMIAGLSVPKAEYDNAIQDRYTLDDKEYDLSRELADRVKLAMDTGVDNQAIGDAIEKAGDNVTDLISQIEKLIKDHANASQQDSTGRTGSGTSLEEIAATVGTSNPQDSRATSGSTKQEEQDFLTSYTESDLTDKDNKAKASKAEAEAANNKTDIDKGVDSFSLSGSDLEADQANAAGQSSLFDQPTDAQAKAGNYPKKHIKMHGLNISIENIEGSTRTGQDEDTGKSWSVVMANDYGDIKGTVGADGDPIDVFIGENLSSDKVFIINQTNKDDSFDEHKVMLGFDTSKSALKAYINNYQKGWTRYGREMGVTSASGFKAWLENGDTSKPYQNQNDTDASPNKVYKRKDRAGRQVYSDNKNSADENILFTVGFDEGDNLASGLLELLGDESEVGGKGMATALYLEALKDAQAEGKGFTSEGVASDATHRMYERLTEYGIPFKKVGTQYQIEPKELSGIDLDDIQAAANEKNNIVQEAAPSPEGFTHTYSMTHKYDSGEINDRETKVKLIGYHKDRSGSGDRHTVWLGSDGIRYVGLEKHLDSKSEIGNNLTLMPGMKDQFDIDVKRTKSVIRKPDQIDPFNATHTYNDYTTSEIRLAGQDETGYEIWIDSKGSIFEDPAGAQLIPGKESQYKDDQVRSENQEPFNGSESGADMLKIVLAAKPEKIVNDFIDTKLKTLENGNMVRKNGGTWALRYKAEQALKREGLSETHMVAGFGNEGPRGREYWIQAKPKLDLAGITEYEIVDHYNEKLGVMLHIELLSFKSEDSKELTLSSIKEQAKIHGYYYRKNGGNNGKTPTVSFENHDDRNEFLELARDQDAIEFGEQPKAETKTKPKSYGSSNKIVSKSRAEELREKLKAKLGTVFSGIDPEIVAIGTELAAFHLEAGARKFTDFAKTMASDLGTTVAKLKPYLRGWYNGARDMLEDSGQDIDGMNTPDEVRELLPTLTKSPIIKSESNEAQNAASTADSVESDSPDTTPSDGLGESDVSGDSRRSGDSTERSTQEDETALSTEDNQRLSDGGPATVGASSDKQIYNEDGTIRTSSSPAGNSERPGGSKPNDTGKPTDGPGTNRADENSTTRRNDELKQRREKQKAADSLPVKFNNEQNVIDTLPMLLPEQQQDVVINENRFFSQNGKGIMCTNGTGTGKTYTGLGTAKRFHNAGKTRILFVAPTQTKVADWIDDAKNLDLNIRLIKDIRDTGRDSVATTYANFRDNPALQAVEWDLVIYDESHKLMENMNGDETATTYAHYYATVRNDNDAESKARQEDHEAWDDYEQQKAAYSKKMADGFSNATLLREHVDKHFAAKTKRLTDRASARGEVLWQHQQENPTKVLFLSASPFASHKSIYYTDGYILNTGGHDLESGAYNSGSDRERYMMAAFGYRMRYNKLTVPESGVDVPLMEREWNQQLREEGVLYGRAIQIDKDYSREFIESNSYIGGLVDEGMYDIIDSETYPLLNALSSKVWNYLYKARLLETLNATASTDRIHEHLALGRKVIIFHNYNEADIAGPFQFREHLENLGIGVSPELSAEMTALYSAHPKLKNIGTGLDSVPKTLQDEFEDQVVLFSGKVNNKDRAANIRDFNTTGSGKDIIVVQKQAGKEGISLHDLDGDAPRVIMTMGIPGSPTDAIQMEGRAYRVGLMSDAIFEYMVTGLRFEKWTYSETVAKRTGTAENLAMGNQARGLEDAFREGYLNPNDDAPSTDQGTGGKKSDHDAIDTTQFDRARSYYFSRQKKSARTKSAEGIDYFATPEPLGLKMVEWADVRPNDRALEPSAGHGAIARWLPGFSRNTAVEPSTSLGADLAMVMKEGSTFNMRFEDLNIVNKFESIIMNPPFGRGGKMAMEHLEKAMGHLADQGRIVALLPTGPMADKRFEALLYKKDYKNYHLVNDIALPSITFERAATSVSTHVVIIERQDNSDLSPNPKSQDWTNIETVKEFFEHIEHVEMPQRTVTENDIGSEVNAGDTQNDGTFELHEFEHTKTGDTMYAAHPVDHLGDGFSIAKKLAKKHEGWYSRFKGNGAVNGFLFKSEDNRAKFMQEAPEALGYEARYETETVSFSLRENDSSEKGQEPDRQDPRKSRSDKPFLGGNEFDQVARSFNHAYKLRREIRPEDFERVTDKNVLSAAERQRFDQAGRFARSFAQNVVFYRLDHEMPLNGFNANGSLYINIETPFDPLAVAGHEMLHQLKKDKPDLYSQLLSAITPHLKNDAFARYKKLTHSEYDKAGADRLNNMEVLEELMADIVGDRFYDGTMADHLKPKLLARLVNFIKTLLAKMGLKKIKAKKESGDSMGSNQYLDDVIAAQVAIKEILAQYQKTTKRKKSTFISYSLASADGGNGGRKSTDNIPDSPESPENTGRNNDASSMEGDDDGFTMYEEEWHESFVRRVQDKFFRVKKLQESIAKSGKTINQEDDVYLAEELSHGRIEQALKAFEKKMVEPLVKAMSAAKVDQVTLDKFLYAKHAQERNAYIAEINPDMPDGGSGMTDAEAQSILDGYPAAKKAQLEVLAKMVYAMSKMQRQVMLKAGLENEETIDAWGNYEFYVPLKGQGEKAKSDFVRKVSEGFSVKGKETRQAMGRRSEADSPLLHTIAQVENTMMRAEKNRVAQRFLNLVEKNPNAGYWKVLKSGHEDRRRRFNPSTREVEFVANNGLRNDEDVIVVKVDGKERYIKVNDERLVRAIRNLGPEPLNKLQSVLSAFNRYLAMVNTSLNPEFVYSNFFRDLQTALLNLRAEGQLPDGKIKDKDLMKSVLGNIPKAMRAIWLSDRAENTNSEYKGDPEWNKHYQEYKDTGAKIGFFGLEGFETKAKRIQEMLDEANGDWQAMGKEGWRNLWQLIQDGNGAVENAVRLSAYVEARKAGLTKEKAASLSKNLTVNFNRTGEWGTMINSLYLFANASIQGTAQLARTLKGKQGRIIMAGLAGFGAALTAMNYALSDDDEDGRTFYDKIPDYIKERNLILMNPFSDSGDYFSFPLPYGYNVFHVAGLLTTELAIGKRQTAEAATMLTGSVLGSFNPIGHESSDNGASAIAKMASPTILDPWVQLAVNENFFGGPIYYEGNPFAVKKPDSHMYFRGTSEVAKWLAQGMNGLTGGTGNRSGMIDISPDSIEHLFGFGTGAAGQFVLRTTKMTETIFSDDPLELRNVPFIRKVVGSIDARGDIDRYYNRRDVIRQYEAEWDQVRRSAPSERIAWRKENKGYQDMFGDLKRADKRLRSLREQRRRIDTAKLPGAEKRKRLKAIDDRIKVVVNRFNSAWESSNL